MEELQGGRKLGSRRIESSDLGNQQILDLEARLATSLCWELLLLLLGLADRQAEFAGVFSAKSLDRTLNDAFFSGILDDHLGPGDYLQDAVMAATQVETAGNHDEKLEDRSQDGGGLDWKPREWNPKQRPL